MRSGDPEARLANPCHNSLDFEPTRSGLSDKALERPVPCKLSHDIRPAVGYVRVSDPKYVIVLERTQYPRLVPRTAAGREGTEQFQRNDCVLERIENFVDLALCARAQRPANLVSAVDEHRRIHALLPYRESPTA